MSGGRRDQRVLTEGLTTVSKESLEKQRASIYKSFNFTLPSSWNFQGDIVLEAEVNPDKTISEATYGNNTEDLTATYSWRAPVNIALVTLKMGTLESTLTNNTDAAKMIAWFKAVMPFNQITWWSYSDGPLEGDWDLMAGGSGCGDGWVELLLDLADLHDSWEDRPANALIYGILPPGVQANAGGCGFVGFPGAAGGTSGTTLAEELGHNIGLYHAPSDRDGQGAVTNSACGNPAGEDSAYPQYSDPDGSPYRARRSDASASMWRRPTAGRTPARTRSFTILLGRMT